MWNPDSSSRYEFQTFPHKVTLGWLCPFIKDDPTPAESSPCLLSFVPLVPLPPLAQQLFCKAVAGSSTSAPSSVILHLFENQTPDYSKFQLSSWILIKNYLLGCLHG